MIKSETVFDIFSTANIEEVVGDFVDLKKKGANYSGLCPFHDEKTPSLMLSPKKNIYKCFGCGKGGNSVSFIMDHKKLTYPEALKYLADKYNIIIEETKPDPAQVKVESLKSALLDFNDFALKYFRSELSKPTNASYLNYLKNRFSPDTIDLFQLGCAPDVFNGLYQHAKKHDYKDEFLLKTGLISVSDKGNYFDFFRNRVVFPIIGYNGQVLSFSGRVLPGSIGDYGKYINGKETPIFSKSNVLFALDQAFSPIFDSKTAILVEGNPDAIRLHDLGIPNVVAPLGTALAVGQIKLLKRFAEKIILLYDGDPAGRNAMLKNGKLLVKSGLVPYAALLPRDHDPDSWFKDKDHFLRWTEKYSTDFISWHSKNLLSKIGNDPSLKNDAINEITSILIDVDKQKRSLYLEQITKSSTVKLKLFTDRLKELESIQIVKEDKSGDIPDGIDATEFNKYGFYEHKNAYYFRTKSGNVKLSNFTMKPLFHIDSYIDSKRIFELVNEKGYRVVINLDMQEITSLVGFQRNIEGKGNFLFWGQLHNFQRLKLKLYKHTRTCTEVVNLGWQREGVWFWSNGMVDSNGIFHEIDEYGLVNHNGRDFFIPAFSKIYIKDKSIFTDERKFMYQESDVKLDKWLKLFLEVHGENAMIAFAWYLSAIFRDHILRINDNFPILNLFGPKGSGKNAIAYSMLSLFGKRQTEFNIHNGTKPGLAKHLEMFRNAIALVDEYKNSLDFDKIETLKSIYNAIGRSRLNMEKGGKKETTEVNSAVILAGQEMPTIDVALSARTIYTRFELKEDLSAYRKKQYQALQDMERDGLAHLTNAFIGEYNYVVKFWKENYDSVMSDLVKATKGKSMNDRILQNICVPIATFKTMSNKFDFPFSYKELFDSGLKIIFHHNDQVSQSDELSIFFNALDSLFDNEDLLKGWQFNIAHKETLLLKNGSRLNFLPLGKVILRLKFNSITKLFSEHLRKSGITSLRTDSLKHYLTNSHYFLGFEKCKFIKTEYRAGEGKRKIDKQVTTAMCFDYDLLVQKYGIDLERESTDADNSSLNNTINIDANIESSTVQAEPDTLNF